ncbi:MAG TPA: LptF/LptG family permease [Gemmatimonadaceae bacterium]|nr:LptF/LptG family permease [Gemmatimonadaceae bacterium]
MSFRILRPLDRYILGAFLKVFLVTAFGFPLLVVIIDATDNLAKYLARNIPPAQVALSYVYYMPESLVMVLPASVLFATVFTIGSLTRHSEVTAAKASGISFYRLIAPLAVGAIFATGIGLVVSELAPVANGRRNAILAEKEGFGDAARYSFAYSGEGNRVYTVNELDARGRGSLRGLEIRRQGRGPDYPTVVTTATSATWTGRQWHLQEGVIHIVPTDSVGKPDRAHQEMALRFVALRDRRMTESPRDLLQKATQPDEMRRAALGRYVRAMERSGQNVNPTRVDLMLRVAIPVTCLIIFLFGAPLATSNQRGGAAFGVGIALATTVLFLMLVQLTKAVGGKGLLTPELAAWIPSMVFGLAGLVLLAKVRT